MNENSSSGLKTGSGVETQSTHTITRKIRPEHDFERVIMGIDPGTNVMGYGVLGINGKQPSVIVMGVIQLSKFESHYLRLARIFERVTGLVEQYLPDELAIEAPFLERMCSQCSSLDVRREWLWQRHCRATYLSASMPLFQ